jgi:triacylglycerol lipase
MPLVVVATVLGVLLLLMLVGGGCTYATYANRDVEAWRRALSQCIPTEDVCTHADPDDAKVLADGALPLTFDVTTAQCALDLITRVVIAYENEASVEEYANMAHVATINTTDSIFGVLMMTTEATPKYVLAMRGMQHASEWRTDRDYLQVSEAGGGVQAGIWRTLQALHDAETELPVVDALLDLVPEEAELLIAGHSLGGGVACVLAVELAAARAATATAPAPSPLPKPLVYTFGAPRVGDAAFADALNDSVSNAFVVINTLDLVPQLPPAAVGNRHGAPFLYQHAGTLQLFQAQVSSLRANHSLHTYAEDTNLQKAALTSMST